MIYYFSCELLPGFKEENLLSLNKGLKKLHKNAPEIKQIVNNYEWIINHKLTFNCYVLTKLFEDNFVSGRLSFSTFHSILEEEYYYFGNIFNGISVKTSEYYFYLHYYDPSNKELALIIKAATQIRNLKVLD